MAQLMDALVKPAPGVGLELRQVPIPEPGPGQVLIKIHKTAICGTDVHIYNWDPWAQEHIKPPMVIGHEYVGEVAKLGAGVTGLHVGQRVSGEGHITCGRCRNCHTGNIQWCKDTKGVGVDRDGAFAEYVCIPESNVIIIDESLDEDVVAFFDAFGNATHTALMWNMVGEDVLITGAGPIGVIAVGICKYAGARRVVITDVNDYRLELARNTIICKGLTMQGIYGRKMDNWHQMSYMVQGGLDLTPVITHRFHYTQFEEGFAAMNSGKSGKVILDWSK